MTSNFISVECAGGIVLYEDMVALIQMKALDGWGFPKGEIELGEEPLQAAVREIYEETGLKNISLVKELGTYQRMAADGSPVKLNIHMFLFEAEQQELAPIEDDVKGARWVLVKEVDRYLILDDDKRFFHSIT